MKNVVSILLVLAAVAYEIRAQGLPADPALLDRFYLGFQERMETGCSGNLYSGIQPRSNQRVAWLTNLRGLGGLKNEHFRYEREWSARTNVRFGFNHVSPREWRPHFSHRMRVWPTLFGELFRDGFHCYSYASEAETFAFSVQPVYGLEVIETDDERGKVSRFTGGFRVETGYARRLYGMVDFRDHTEAGNGPYDAREKLYEDRWAAVDLKGNSSTSYDLSESILQYTGRHLAIAAGRGRHHWGPGYFGGLVLNGNAPPFDYARFDADFHLVSYTFLHGFLKSLEIGDSLYVNPDGRPRTLDAQKFLSAQRLEVAPRDNLLLAFSQAVVYGDRGVQLGYLTPLNFLYSVQHSNDDKDNLLLSLDGKWRPVRGLKLYGELLLDDVLVGDLFTGSGSTKNAYTLGVHGMVPRRFWDHFDARFEYTKLRPFVYSHFFAVNTYSHWTSPLGYTREPNSEFINVRLGASFYPLFAAVAFRRQNHGANTESRNVGGSIDAANYAGNDEDFPFLAGKFEQTDEVSVSLRYEALPNLNLQVEAARLSKTGQSGRTEWRVGAGWNL